MWGCAVEALWLGALENERSQTEARCPQRCANTSALSICESARAANCTSPRPAPPQPSTRPGEEGAEPPRRPSLWKGVGRRVAGRGPPEQPDPWHPGLRTVAPGRWGAARAEPWRSGEEALPLPADLARAGSIQGPPGQTRGTPPPAGAALMVKSLRLWL